MSPTTSIPIRQMVNKDVTEIRAYRRTFKAGAKKNIRKSLLVGHVVDRRDSASCVALLSKYIPIALSWTPCVNTRASIPHTSITLALDMNHDRQPDVPIDYQLYCRHHMVHNLSSIIIHQGNKSIMKHLST